MSNLKPIIEESFTQYAGAVLQSRALVDVRDCLKPSARQIFYCMYTDKFVHNKPFKKTLKAIGSAMRVYIHGDSSCEGVIMRAGQPFAMRYPLIEVEGSYGNLMESGNYAAPRYTSARLSELANYLFADIDKDTITEWRDNYDDTEKYPAVLPTKGFFNIVNGSSGIATGLASSIPQFNLREVNEALIKLLWNPDIDFNEIYCAPDFATGAVLLNEDAVKDSLRTGNGFACKLRSVVEYDSKEKCFVVKEIPYSVYTNTICAELEAILEAEDNPGVDRFNDLTGATPLIKIYLTKNANPDRVLKYLYKNTSLQYHYGINMTMLENSRYPKVYGWKDLLQAHLDHELAVYRNAFEYDLKKIKARIHIIEGLLKAYDAIDEVIHTIKTSASSQAANTALCKLLGIDDIQAKAILDLKLAKLSKLDISKLCDEKKSLETERQNIELILTDDTKMKEEVEKGLRDIADRFGDARRTKIMNIAADESEPVEVKRLQVALTNRNNIVVTESSTLYTQKRGGVGAKVKLENGEAIIDSIIVQSNQEILLFSTGGRVYHTPLTTVELGEKTSLFNLIPLQGNDEICAIITKDCHKKYIVFVTKNGIIKKSEISEYQMTRNTALNAIKLDEGDQIKSILFADDEKIGILTATGNFLLTELKDVRAIGRVTRGIQGIKLNDGDYVVGARLIDDSARAIVSISCAGQTKQTAINEFAVQGKNTKGSRLQKLSDNDLMADFQAVAHETDALVTASRSCIKIKMNEIPMLSRGTIGNKAIKLSSPSDKVIRISIY